MFTLLDDVAYHGLLSASQSVLLRHLMDAGCNVPKADLAEALWGHRADGGGVDTTICCFMAQLRPQLRPGFRIESRRGFGYRLVIDEEALERALIAKVAEMLSDRSAGDQAA